jgi:peptidyl-tRNA hydrolase
MTPLDAFGQHIHDLLADRKATMAAFTSDYRPLNMYAIYRADLDMPPGKIAAQCGHAFARAAENAEKASPGTGARYRGTGNGTKICMYAKNEGQLLRAYREMLEQGIPCELIIDRGHLLPPHFDGNPIITALGIGPVYRDEIANTLKRYTLAP